MDEINSVDVYVHSNIYAMSKSPHSHDDCHISTYIYCYICLNKYELSNKVILTNTFLIKEHKNTALVMLTLP